MSEQVTQDYNYEAENVVIQAILLDGELAVDIGLIVKDHRYFSQGDNRDLYQAVQSLIIQGKPIDYLHVTTKLAETGKLDQMGGPGAVSKYLEIDGYIPPETAISAAKMVAESYHKRIAKRTLQNILQQVAAANGDLQKVLSESVERVTNLWQFLDEEKGHKPVFAFLSCDDLAAMPEPDMLIEGILAEGDTAMIYGSPASGKTFVTIDLAAAAISGQKWASLEITRPLKVLYATNEGKKRIPMRIGEALKHRNITPDQRRRLHVLLDLPQLFDKSSEKNVKVFIDECKRFYGDDTPDLIILDTMRNATTGANLDSGQDVSTVNEAINVIKDELQGTVLIVHHNNKSDQGGPIGSIHIQGHMDLVIKAEAKKGYHKILFEKVKDDDAPPSQAYQIESGLESGWIRWEGEAKNAETRHDADIQDILAALNEHPGEWMTVSEVLEYVPINKQKAHRILNGLTKQRDFGVEKQLMDSFRKPSKSNPVQFRTFVRSSGY